MPTVRIAPANAADTEVAELLFAAIGGDRPRLATATRRYENNKAAHVIAATMNDELAGVAGYEIHRNHVQLLHIATVESRRRCGIGHRLLTEIRSRRPDLALVAETDNESLGFYLAVGFTATSLGEKYPGVERYEVRLNPASG